MGEPWKKTRLPGAFCRCWCEFISPQMCIVLLSSSPTSSPSPNPSGFPNICWLWPLFFRVTWKHIFRKHLFCSIPEGTIIYTMIWIMTPGAVWSFCISPSPPWLPSSSNHPVSHQYYRSWDPSPKEAKIQASRGHAGREKVMLVGFGAYVEQAGHFG